MITPEELAKMSLSEKVKQHAKDMDNTLKIWLREQDKTLFGKLCEISLDSYRDQILTGILDNPGLLAKIGDQFVLGRERVWIPKDTDQKYHFVRINNSSAYQNGLMLTPYSSIDVDYHLKTKRVDRTTRFEREELVGMDTEDFVERVFGTYYSFMVRKWNEKDQHFLLYSTYVNI